MPSDLHKNYMLLYFMIKKIPILHRDLTQFLICLFRRFYDHSMGAKCVFFCRETVSVISEEQSMNFSLI